MVYIDLKDEKEKKELSTELEKININHNDISVTNKAKNSIIISDNDIQKIKEYHKNYKNIIIYNKNKEALIDKIYYDKGIYSYNVIDELKTILEVISDKRKKNINIDKVLTAIIMLALILTTAITGPKLLKNINKNIPTSTTKTEIVAKEKTEEKPKEIEDYKKENIVFYGDSITQMYLVEKFFPDYPVVNAGHSGYMTPRLLEEIEDNLLVYNPTKVFLLMGTNDLAYNNLNNEEIVENIKKIVDILRKDRKNVKIYIESIYPVKETKDFDANVWHMRENSRIREINLMLKDLCNKEKLTYINMYDILKDEDGSIKEEYTIEGLHITQEGYKVITENLLKYIKEA